MRRGLLVLAIVVALGVGMTAQGQVPTAEQLELLRSMSPEDRQDLMEQLGLGNGTLDESMTGPGKTGGENRGSLRTSPLVDLQELERKEKTLQPKDTILLGIQFKKDKPARVESGGPGMPPITIPAELAPVLEETERLAPKLGIPATAGF